MKKMKRTAIERILKESVNFLLIIPLFMVLSTVFIIDESLANGITSGKYFWFYLSIGVTSVTTLIMYAINCKKIEVDHVDILLLLFGICGVSVSFYNNQRFSNDLILFVLVLILYFYFKVINTQFRKAFYFLILFVMVTGLIEAIWGLMQLHGFSSSQHHLFKITGSFFNPGPFGGYLSVIIPISFYFLLHDNKVLSIKTWRLKLFPFYLRLGISSLSFCAILLVLPSTMSRASWIAATAGCCISYLLHTLRRKSKRIHLRFSLRKNIRKIIIGSTMAITILIVALVGIYNMKKDSADGRTLIWKVGIETIKNNPAGVGIGNFSGAYGLEQAKYFESGTSTPQEQLVAGNPEYAFNEFIQICVEHGIFSFLIYVCILILSIYNGIKNKNCELVGAFIAFLLFSFMSYPLNLLPFIIIFVFLLCFLNKKNTKKQEKHIFKIYFILSICLTLICLSVYNRYPIHDAYKKWNRAKTLYNVGLYAEASEEYKKLETRLNHEISFLFEYAQSLSKSEKYNESNEILTQASRISCDPMLYNIKGKNYQALKEYEKAKECFTISSNIVPSRLYPYYLLGKLYDEMGNKNMACEMAQIVQKKEPKVHSPAVEEMRIEMKEICVKYKTN